MSWVLVETTRAPSPPNQVEGAAPLDCLGVTVSRLSWDQFLSWFLARLSGSKPVAPGILFLANAHTLNLAWRRPAARAALRAASLVLNDGIGLDIYARLRSGRSFPYNFAGTDLIPRLLSECSLRGVPLRVFLFGALPDRAAEAARRLQAAYPLVRVVGVLDGYASDDEAVCTAIAAAQPDLLLVGLGNPRQEEWLATHAPALRARVAIGVGALFDFLSGAVPRAPRWMRALRLEWFFRLAREPRRLFARYVIGIPLFLWRTLTYRSPAAPAKVIGAPPRVALLGRAAQTREARVSPGLPSPHPEPLAD